MTVENAKFQKDHWHQTWQEANIDDYQDDNIRRTLRVLKQLGTAALSESELIDVSIYQTITTDEMFHEIISIYFCSSHKR